MSRLQWLWATSPALYYKQLFFFSEIYRFTEDITIKTLNADSVWATRLHESDNITQNGALWLQAVSGQNCVVTHTTCIRMGEKTEIKLQNFGQKISKKVFMLTCILQKQFFWCQIVGCQMHLLGGGLLGTRQRQYVIHISNRNFLTSSKITDGRWKTLQH